jgi:hypothetical protein
MRQGSNEWSPQINQQDKEFTASKWIEMSTIKAELCKITNTLEKNLFGLARVG